MSEEAVNDNPLPQEESSGSATLETKEEDAETTTRKRPNKTEKKLLRYKKKLDSYKKKKLEMKQLRQQQAKEDQGKKDDDNEEAKERKLNPAYDAYINKRELKRQINERLGKVYGEEASSSLKICIDCAFSEIMSTKEMSRLAQQIGRCYATNKTLKQPSHLTLCNLDKISKFYTELCRVNDGFEHYIINTTQKKLDEYLASGATHANNVVYLSPDASECLEEVDTDSIYVIGGLVDETVSKKVTLTKCAELKIQTRCLPIERYMSRMEERTSNNKFNYSRILSINQVFDILTSFFVERDWSKALGKNVPKRKGYYVPETS